MFERFTASSRRVMVLTQDEARALGHNVIAPHHVALGLVRLEQERGDGPLTRLGVDLEGLREAIVEEAATAVPAGVRRASPPFTPECKRALELALREALKLGDNFISPGHQLLALVRSEQPTVLARKVGWVNAEVMVREWHGTLPEEEKAGRRKSGQQSRLKGFVEVMKAAMSRGKPDRPPGSHDILLTLVSMQETLAGRILKELGVTEEKVTELAELIGTAGTLDEPELEPDEVPVGDQTIRIADPAAREALREVLGADPELAERLRAALERRVKETDN